MHISVAEQAAEKRRLDQIAEEKQRVQDKQNEMLNREEIDEHRKGTVFRLLKQRAASWESEGDGIKSRQPSKRDSTLFVTKVSHQNFNQNSWRILW